MNYLVFPTLDIAAGVFFPAKSRSQIFGHVRIEKSVFLLVFYVFYVLFNELSRFVPTLDIAAGAFFPQQ